MLDLSCAAGVDSHPQSCSLTVVPDNGLVHVFPGSDVTFVCSATCLGALSRDQLVWRDPHGNIVASFGGDRYVKSLVCLWGRSVRDKSLSFGRKRYVKSLVCLWAEVRETSHCCLAGRGMSNQSFVCGEK